VGGRSIRSTTRVSAIGQHGGTAFGLLPANSSRSSAAAVWPLAALAQQRAKLAAMGLLDFGAAATPIARLCVRSDFTGALPVAAQDYLAHPITLVVPFFPPAAATMRWRASSMPSIGHRSCQPLFLYCVFPNPPASQNSTS
jgi:hypothetical protein